MKGFEGYYQVSDMGRVKSLPRWNELHFESRGYTAYRWMPERILK
ncbi:NUMOD4 domain-containing protein [Chitinophagaceae bacterium LWZ2-11]